MKVKQKSASLAQVMLDQSKTTLRAQQPRPLKRGASEAKRGVMELIEEEVRAERMDPEKALVSKVHALFAPAKLPRAMRSMAAIAKCTTPQLRQVVRELKEHYPQLSAKTKAEVAKYIRLQKRGNDYVVEYPGLER